jgi:hypothetical protein
MTGKGWLSAVGYQPSAVGSGPRSTATFRTCRANDVFGAFAAHDSGVFTALRLRRDSAIIRGADDIERYFQERDSDPVDR